MNPRTRILRDGLVVVLVLCACITAVQATTLVYYGTEKLLDDCEFVIQGRVVENQCAYHDTIYDSNRHEIYTFTTIEVERSWAWDNPTATITLEEIGGQVGTRISTVDGIPRFVEGTEVLVFVERRPNGHFKTFCMFLGAFTVTRDPEEGIFLNRPVRVAGTKVLDGDYGNELITPDAMGQYALGPFIEALESRLDAEGR